MLAMQLQISLRDAVRVGHVVVDTCSRQSMRAATVFLRPANRGVDRHIGYVDTLRHQFPRHALCQSSLRLTRHRKGAAQREAFERCACVGEDDRSFRAVGVDLVFAHQPSCLRNISGTRPSMLCTTSVGAPRSRTTFWNSKSTAAGSLASHAYRRTPCVFSRFSSTGLSALLAAMATRIPFFANSLAQLELMPGPPPTISATSCVEG